MLDNSLFDSSKFKKNVVNGAETTFYSWSWRQPNFGRSQSRLRDLRLPEPEPPKKVAAPQHWFCKRFMKLASPID